MNEHLAPVFEIVLPSLEKAGIAYGVFGGVAIAGIAGEFVRHNPDVDVFVFDQNYEKTIALVNGLETNLNWESKDTPLQRGRPKREWFIADKNKEIFSVVPIYPEDSGKILFKFGYDFVPNSSLTFERYHIGKFSFFGPSKDLIKELLVAKSNERKPLTRRIVKSKIDAKVIMSEVEYKEFCARLNRFSET